MSSFAIHNSEYDPILDNWPENVSAKQINCLEGINSNIQDQINTKISSVALNDITDWPMTVTSSEVAYLDNVTSNIQDQLDNKPNSDISGVVGADAVTNIISLTQNEYDVIGAPNSSTLYVIT